MLHGEAQWEPSHHQQSNISHLASNSMEASESRTDESVLRGETGGGWVFPVLLLVVLIAGLAIFRPGQGIEEKSRTTGADSVGPPSARPTGETVRLEIDFGNGVVRQFAALPWQPDMTVGDLMQAAQEFRPGIRYIQQGSGPKGFLTSLDGVSNQGMQKQNWRFSIDGRLGDTSFCVAKLSPGATVLWEFTAEY